MPCYPLITRPRFLSAAIAMGLLGLRCGAQQIEYLPPVAWQAPPVIKPGVTDDAPPSDAVVLFDGNDLSAWENAEGWRIEEGVAVCGPGRLTTKAYFGDCQLHVQWSAPSDVRGAGQGRGNSGVRMMGDFEVQVLDSYNNPTYPDGQAAAIYKQTPPMVNATRPPGEWNSYDIFWRAPRYAGRKLAEPAVVSVVHNGVLVVDRFEVQGDTSWDHPPKYADIGPRGPIVLQHHGDPVRYRNIWVRELHPPVGEERPARFIDHSTGRGWKIEEVPDSPRVEVESMADIDYVGQGNPRQKLDLYLPAERDLTRPIPLVCYIHGGGWSEGNKSPANLVHRLAETGRYAAASIGYRLSDESRWPSQIHDCKAAVRWLRANAAEHGFDPERIGVWGISAGGHLAAMLGVSQGVEALEGDLGPHTEQPSQVACVVNWFGPSDLIAMNSQGSTIDAASADSVVARLMGGVTSTRQALYESASPLRWVTPDDAPMLLVHGTRDPLVPFEQSAELHHALQSRGVPAAMLAVQGAGHGGLGDHVTRACYAFLESQLGAGSFEMGYNSVAGPNWERLQALGTGAEAD